jgi:hypothetical protein
MPESTQFNSGAEPLWELIVDSATRGDLEAHLSLFILQSSLRSIEATDLAAPWLSALTSVLGRALPTGPLNRPQDVATLGLRLALGRDHSRAEEFARDARREIARQPLPPAACIRDDIRVLLGIAAGVGRVAPASAADIVAILQDRQHLCSFYQACLDIFAEALLEGSGTLGPELAVRATSLLTMPSASRPPAESRDRIAAFWLATRILDAEWRPTDAQLAALGRLIDDTARACRLLLRREPPALDPVDAAMLLDAMTAAPATKLTRVTEIDRLLTLTDRFSASASILANRQRDRTPLTLEDEYDLQDLFHALSVPVVRDIVREDPTPKLAGRSSRLDFTSKSLQLGVELKYVRSASHGKEVRQELLVDEATYQAHPFVSTVIAFVYDPGSHIPLAERASFEADLSVTITIEARAVRYIVRVR